MSYKVITYAELSKGIPALASLGPLAEPENLQKFMDLIADFQIQSELRFVQLFRGGADKVGLKVIFEEWLTTINPFEEEKLFNDSLPEFFGEYDGDNSVIPVSPELSTSNETPQTEETFGEKMARLRKEKKETGSQKGKSNKK
jgi:hypothetical protein